MTPRTPEPGFDDPRDSDVARMWLDVAGVAEARAESATTEETASEETAGGAARHDAPSGPAPDAPPDLGALLTRASDLPAPADGPISLPWSTPAAPRKGSTGRAGRRGPSAARRGRSERDDGAEGSGSSARRRRPGPAPLPEDPSEREAAAREVVLRQLAMGPRSRRQLERKLAEREAEPELITRVLDRLEEVQLVDDAAFAEVWVRSRHRSRGLSRRALGRELQDKGVDREVAEEALEGIDPEDERAAARELVDRRLRGRPVPAADGPAGRAERDKAVRRLVGMLGRRGYGPGLAFDVVREALQDREA